MELLRMDCSNKKKEGKMRGYEINQIMKLWNYQDREMQLAKTGRMDRRRTHFCDTQNLNFLVKSNSLNQDFPTVEEMANTKTIHIPLHLGKHWGYVCVHLDLPHRKMIYYDSEKYSSQMRDATKQQKEDRNKQQMTKLEVLLNKHLQGMMKLKEYTDEQIKNALKPFTKITDTTKLPKQSDDVSCGVFLLFSMDCMRRGYEIKAELTADEILSYRVKIYEYIESAKELQDALENPKAMDKKKPTEIVLID